MNGEQRISPSLDEVQRTLSQLVHGSSDVVSTELTVSGHRCIAYWCDGMTNTLQSWQLVFKRLLEMGEKGIRTPQELVSRLTDRSPEIVDCKRCSTYGEMMKKIFSGGVAVAVEGSGEAVCTVLPGFQHRSVSESATEDNVRASREGFAEPLKVNMTLIRRRIKSGLLVFETMSVGTVSNTDVALVYLCDRVSRRFIDSIKKRLERVDVELVLESGFIEPYFESAHHSLFSSTGHTERPDTLCGKLREGRVGILVDGSPFAIILPYLFGENFQSFDDYTNKAYYASFVRVIKYLAFFTAVLLPGFFVAVATFNPELIPQGLLYNLAESQNKTPLPLVAEALFINLVYELVREAGLRLPRPVGHTVSLVGALVIGDAAVNAGFVGGTMVMAVALTAVCSFVLPTLYEPITVLRFVFIIVGGMLGTFGLTLGVCMLLLNICSINTYGVPFTAPLTPYDSALFSDGLIRRGWQRSAGEAELLSELNGSELSEDDEGR